MTAMMMSNHIEERQQKSEQQKQLYMDDARGNADLESRRTRLSGPLLFWSTVLVGMHAP